MKALAMCCLVGAALLTGCVSETRSYDANGNLLGKCQASRAFFLGSDAVCTGSSNPKDQGEAAPIIAQPRKPEDASCPAGQSFKFGQCYPDKALLRGQ